MPIRKTASILEERQNQWLKIVRQIYDNAPTRKDQIALKWMLWLASFFNMTRNDRIDFVYKTYEAAATFDQLTKDINEYRQIRTTSDNRAAPHNKASSRRALSPSVSQGRGARPRVRQEANDYQKASRNPRANTVPNTNTKYKRREA